MKSLKKTTFLEAVAAAIEHEVKSFNFFLNLSSKLNSGPIRELFEQLAEDGDKHIEFIKDIYRQAEGQELPNLKTLSQIHKFHSSTIQLLMDRLERNMNQEVGSDERKALELAVLHGRDAIHFYSKLKDKFPDPKINLLFSRLQDFIETNTNLLEAQVIALEQATPIDAQFFWDDLSLMEEATRADQPTKAKRTKHGKAKKKQQSLKTPKKKSATKNLSPKKGKSKSPSASKKKAPPKKKVKAQRKK